MRWWLFCHFSQIVFSLINIFMHLHKGSSENCSTMKCSSNGTCINTSFSPMCNCSEGFTGPSCEISK